MPQPPNLAETIYRDLLRRVLTGEVRAGARLEPERVLAGRYGATRNTLREAIRKLEHAHLVAVRQGSGVTVLDFRRTATAETIGPFLVHGRDPSERARVLSDVLAARSSLLELSVRLAAERAQAADIDRLRTLQASQLACYEAGEVGPMLEAEVRFIDALVDAAHSLPARWMANSLLPVFEAVVAAAPALWVWDTRLPDYLEGLLAALSAADSGAAMAITRNFFDGVDERLHALLGLSEPPPP